MFTPGAGKKKGEFSGTVDPSDSSDSDEEMVDVSAIPAIGKPNAGKGKEKAVAVASDEEKPAPSKKDKGKEKEDKRFDNTLPDDMHFSSRQLVTLFLKPKFSVSASSKGERCKLICYYL